MPLFRTYLLVAFMFFCNGAVLGAENAPSALVQAEALQQRIMQKNIIAYGQIIPDPSNVVSISEHYAGILQKLFVQPGQIVKKGDPLFSFATDPSAKLGYKQAESSLTFARAELKRNHLLFQERLVTRSQLETTEKAFKDALATYNTEKQKGTDAKVINISAPFDSIVLTINSSQGDNIAADAVVLQLAKPTSLLAKLGVNPVDSQQIKIGLPIHIEVLTVAHAEISTKLFQVYALLNPQSSLVDVAAQLSVKDCEGLLPGMKIKGIITLESSSALATARSAVLHDDAGYFVYKIDNYHAIRVNVTPGIEDDNHIGITGNVHAEDLIVTAGNYELKNNMLVRE